MRDFNPTQCGFEFLFTQAVSLRILTCFFCFLFFMLMLSCCHVEPLLRTLISVHRKRGSLQRDWERARKKGNKKERRRKKETKRKEKNRKKKGRKQENQRKTDRQKEEHKERKEEGNQKQVLGSAHGYNESYSGYQIILGINHS